jgi:UDP-glucuronate 4-epimerase
VPFNEEDRADRPASPYAASKRAGELLCATYSHLYGIRCTCLRFFSVYGPRGRPDMAVWKFTEGILRKPPVVVYGDGSIRRDLTYVTDIVDGILAALDLGPRYDIFNLGDERPIAMAELISIIEKATGRKAQIEYRPAKPEDVPVTYADITKAKEVLGYSPKVGIEEGVRRFVEWYQDQ